jgi:hypothetical protein
MDSEDNTTRLSQLLKHDPSTWFDSVQLLSAHASQQPRPLLLQPIPLVEPVTNFADGSRFALTLSCKKLNSKWLKMLSV